MKHGKFLTAVIFSLMSAVTFANDKELVHVETGQLIFDESSFFFSKRCGEYAEAFATADGLDVVYENGINSDSDFEALTCYFRLTLDIPEGWFVKIYSDAAVTGYQRGDTVVTLEHTGAGTSARPVHEEFAPGSSGGYEITSELIPIGVSKCEDRKVSIKTVAQLLAFEPGARISMGSGSIAGQTRTWKYSLVLEEC